VSLILFLQDQVEKEVDHLVPAKVTEVVSSDSFMKDRRDAETKAREAYDDAVTLQDAVKKNEQRVMSDALTSINDAERKADELRTKAEQLDTLIDISKINAKIDSLIQDPQIRKEIEAKVLPTGSVVAFDRSTGCPENWTTFLAANGRTIIGAGPPTNADVNGQALTGRPLGAVGGEEKHKLSIPEMPAHTHGLGPVPNYYNFANGGGDPKTIFGSNGPAPAGETQSAGGDQPHNIMPPFIALYYCKKEK